MLSPVPATCTQISPPAGERYREGVSARLHQSCASSQTPQKKRQPNAPVPVGRFRDTENTRLPSEGFDPARQLREVAAFRLLPYLSEGHPSIFNCHQRLLSFRHAIGLLPQKITRRVPSTDGLIYHNGLFLYRGPSDFVATRMAQFSSVLGLFGTSKRPHSVIC